MEKKNEGMRNNFKVKPEDSKAKQYIQGGTDLNLFIVKLS